MARKILDLTKRLSYVSRNSINSDKEMENMFSDDDIEVPLKKKVRKEFSISEFRKSGEHFDMDEDHLYSKSKTIAEPQEQKFCGSGRGCITRSRKTSKVQNGDLDVNQCSIERISVKRAKCTSKNAIMARINRMKKKQYVSSLEDANKELQGQNGELQQCVTKLEKTIVALQHEIKYLKSLLANSKEISDILKNLKNSTGLPVTSSLQPVITDVSDENVHTVKTEKNIYRQAHVKRVTSGSNFPILQADVNLGYYNIKESNQDEFSYNIDEETYFSFSGVSDLSLDGILLNEGNLDFRSSVINDLTKKDFEALEDSNEEVLLKTPDLNEIESNVGLCLHINKRKISVELCSICNGKAQSQQTELGDYFES